MKTVKLLRTFGNEKETLGSLTVTGPTGVLFVCKTLELGDHNNASGVSCILAGKYTCKYTRSNSFSLAQGHDVYTYEIVGVPNRAGIRIHSANFFTQLRGCISFGDAFKDINADGQLDVVHSGATVTLFEKIMNLEDFELEIIESKIQHI